MQLFDILTVLYESINPLDDYSHLLSYVQPRLNEDGSCPTIKVPGDVYDLTQYAESPEQLANLTDMLIRLTRLVRWVHLQTNVDWFGIYLCNGDKLVKYVYTGSMSKAEFPIAKEYLEKSINTRVMLERRYHYIPDIANYNGAYYQCDASVQSELCCPIFDPFGSVIGIFDCEDHRKHFFDDQIDLVHGKVKKAIEIFLADHPYILHSGYSHFYPVDYES